MVLSENLGFRLVLSHKMLPSFIGVLIAKDFLAT